jgi:adenylate cyclase
VVGIAGIYLIFGVRAYLLELRTRHRIQNAFGQYVSPEVATQLINSPEDLKLEGQRCRLTIMFSDLAGFTELSERLDAEIIVMILNEYTGALGEVIRSNHGTIDKFIGDGIMAFWGAPLKDPEQEKHACQAAKEMVARLEELNEEFRQRGWPSLSVRIGVHTGDAIVGNIGGEQHMDYTVVGDNVNLASRLESVNKLYGTNILISGSTTYTLGSSFSFRWLDRIRVKGKSQAIEVYTICGDAELNERTAEAIKAHRAREWDTAETLWRAIKERYPADKLADLYLEKIAQYRESPPDRDWDGSTTLSSK